MVSNPCTPKMKEAPDVQPATEAAYREIASVAGNAASKRSPGKEVHLMRYSNRRQPNDDNSKLINGLHRRPRS